MALVDFLGDGFGALLIFIIAVRLGLSFNRFGFSPERVPLHRLDSLTVQSGVRYSRLDSLILPARNCLVELASGSPLSAKEDASPCALRAWANADCGSLATPSGDRAALPNGRRHDADYRDWTATQVQGGHLPADRLNLRRVPCRVKRIAYCTHRV